MDMREYGMSRSRGRQKDGEGDTRGEEDAEGEKHQRGRRPHRGPAGSEGRSSIRPQQMWSARGGCTLSYAGRSVVCVQEGTSAHLAPPRLVV